MYSLTDDGNRETKNLTIFLIGVHIYLFLYIYLQNTEDRFLRLYANLMWWIITADAFAMGIIYKNYWGNSILTEVKEVMEGQTTKVFTGQGEEIAVAQM